MKCKIKTEFRCWWLSGKKPSVEWKICRKIVQILEVLGQLHLV